MHDNCISMILWIAKIATGKKLAAILVVWPVSILNRLQNLKVSTIWNGGLGQSRQGCEQGALDSAFPWGLPPGLYENLGIRIRPTMWMQGLRCWAVTFCLSGVSRSWKWNQHSDVAPLVRDAGTLSRILTAIPNLLQTDGHLTRSWQMLEICKGLKKSIKYKGKNTKTCRVNISVFCQFFNFWGQV